MSLFVIHSRLLRAKSSSTFLYWWHHGLSTMKLPSDYFPQPWKLIHPWVFLMAIPELNGSF